MGKVVQERPWIIQFLLHGIIQEDQLFHSDKIIRCAANTFFEQMNSCGRYLGLARKKTVGSNRNRLINVEAF